MSDVTIAALARPEKAATDYTVPMSIEGIFVTVIGSAGLGLAGVVGFPALLSAAVAVAAAGAVVTPLWIRRHAGAPAQRLVSQTHGVEQ